ncbi:MAG: galactose mutarotase, partial [Flavobacteriaceae bacterium]
MKQVTIKNSELILTALDYGAVIQKLMFRDKNGRWLNMVASLEDPEDYLSDEISLGATVGRFAG